MSEFYVNPNPTPGAGASFSDREVHFQTPIKRIMLGSRNATGALYVHTSPLGKVAVGNVIPVTGAEKWFPMVDYRSIRFKTPIRMLYFTGDGGNANPPDFTVIGTTDIDEVELEGPVGSVPNPLPVSIVSPLDADGMVKVDEYGTPNLAANQVSVGNAAPGTQIVAARATRRAVLITNLGTTDVFIGNSGVTTATGTLLPGIKGASITIPVTVAVFGIVAAGSQSVSFIEVYD